MADNNYTNNENDSSLVETPQDLIEATIFKVENILKEHFPTYLSFGDGTFTITRGSTQVMIIVRPFTKDETCIDCISHVVTGAKITDDLMRFLLRKNAELHFGSFGLLFDDTITFSYSLAGMNLDPNELRTALDSIAVIADHYDDVIVGISGGKRAVDLVDNHELE